MICDNCKQETDLWVKVTGDKKICVDCFEKRKGVIRGLAIFILLMLGLLIFGITTL
jgi:hypothetical protein